MSAGRMKHFYHSQGGNLINIKPRSELDKSLNSGERQVFDDIKLFDKWHRWRYAKALDFILPTDSVIDLGCGVGYGCTVLAEKAQAVFGVDDSFESIRYGWTHFPSNKVTLINKDIHEIGMTGNQWEVVTAFEILEHCQDTDKFFDLLYRICRRTVVLSCPDVKLDATLYPFHYRHFSDVDLQFFFNLNGFIIKHIEPVIFTGGPGWFCVAEVKK
jgi:2-polyprenyl-3-methyl-5-hydroxy-6-metoxy-1,4-benzoquinol methylase